MSRSALSVSNLTILENLFQNQKFKDTLRG